MSAASASTETLEEALVRGVRAIKRIELTLETQAIDRALDAHQETCGCDDEDCEQIAAIQSRIDNLREAMKREGIDA